ncbi:lipase 3-like [Bacillus rossius redtenbacheri]|uniref:lipase 3-like n=1 Tax=Bacillus rossius redtenbacheri TaxID=93214 RepID=UPI002FDE830B
MRVLATVLCALQVALALPETYMDALQLARRWGYPCEAHTAVTEDGYLLTLHRVPRGREAGTGTAAAPAAPGPPVLLQHGLLAASDLWLLLPPGKSLAFMLADRGYDVWLGNVRGNAYGRRHLNMSASAPAFWDFSFHEHGLLDLAAMVDAVLAASGHERLHFVGHSMGTSMFFALASLRPRYGSKVRLAVHLAPAVFLGHIRIFGARQLLPHRDAVSTLLDRLGVREFVRRSPLVARIAEEMCSDGSRLKGLCIALFVLTFGDDMQHINKTALPSYLSHVLAGGSKKTILHFAQAAATGRFQMFDHGPAGNRRKYGSEQPPEYPLQQVTTPCSLHYGAGDLLIAPAVSPVTQPSGWSQRAFIYTNIIIKLKSLFVCLNALISPFWRASEAARQSAQSESRRRETVDDSGSRREWSLSQDVLQLAARLPHAVGTAEAARPKFNHIDFLLSLDADKLVYEPVLAAMARF